jgi:DNA-binding HxlR family transcriptional regulator
MTLPSTYADRNCSLARTLEVVGERWTLLVVRDAFFGVRRFGDFATRLGIPRAVLTGRLKSLVLEGVLSREADAAGSIEYRLTDKGTALWPVVRTMMSWGDTFYSPAGVRRVLRHDLDGACSIMRDAAPTAARPSLSRKSGPSPDRDSSQPAPAAIPRPGRSAHRDDSSNRSPHRPDPRPAKADRRGAVAGGADQGVTPRDSDADTVTAALSQPHRLLDDIRGLSQAPPPGSRRPSKTGRPSA